jgi:hypothetical protein
MNLPKPPKIWILIPMIPTDQVARRKYDKNAKVSGDWVAAYAKETAVAQSTWNRPEQKMISNFSVLI